MINKTESEILMHIWSDELSGKIESSIVSKEAAGLKVVVVL